MDSDPGEGTSDGRIKRNGKRKAKRKFKSNVPDLTIKEETVIKAEPIEREPLHEHTRQPNTVGVANIITSESESETDDHSSSDSDEDFMKKEIKSECEEEKSKKEYNMNEQSDQNEGDNQANECGNIPQASPNRNGKKCKSNARGNARNRILTQKKKMTNGSKKSRSKQPKLHKCHSCDYTTLIKTNFTDHIRTHTGEKPFKCEICAKSFKQKQHLNGHKKIHLSQFEFHCSKCRMGFAQEIEKNNHQDKCQRRQFECYLCPFSTLHLTNLKQHMRVHHTGEKPFGCSVCAKTFPRKEKLNYHLRTHVKQLPFECTKCCIRFINENQKQSHEERCSRRQYECHLCSYKSFKISHLKQHMRSHTGEKPFRCAVCQKRFVQKCNLNSHLRIHTK